MALRLLAGTFLVIALFAGTAAAQGYYGEPQSLGERDGDDSDLLMPPVPMARAVPSPTDVQVRLQSMDAQLRNMQGIVEKLQFRNQQLEQQLARMNGDHDVRFQMLERKLGEHDSVIKAMPMAASDSAAAPAEDAVDEAKGETVDAPAKTSEKTLGTLSTGGKNAGDAQALYDQAFMALRQAKYDDAERDFKAFLKGNPKHRLTENAKYWLAETYYVRGKYSDAAVVFAETYQEFPQGSKAPDNLLKLAMSLGGLKKTQDACLTLGELKKRFPTVSAGIRNRAEQEKKNLGCA